MSKIQPVRWLSRHAASGLKDLPRNSAWLLSKAISAPADAAGVGNGVPDGLRRVTAAISHSIPGVHDAVELRLKRAELAVAKAREAEKAALVEAQNANALADAAKAIGDEGRERVRQATRDSKLEVDRRTQLAKEHYAQLIDRERDKASREASEALERITNEIRTTADKAREVAEAAAELAQGRIYRAHQQMAEARALASEATAAAERVAEEAHQHARAVADDAEQRAGSADRVLGDARRTEAMLAKDAAHAVRAEQTQDAPARLTEHTKAELLQLAQPLEISGASRMTKTELIKAIRSASRTRVRA